MTRRKSRLLTILIALLILFTGLQMMPAIWSKADTLASKAATKVYVKLIRNANYLDVGQSFTFEAKAVGLKAAVIRYSVSDTNLASINSKTGMLTALGEGKVTIKAYDQKSNKYDTCELQIFPAILTKVSGGMVAFGNYPQSEVTGKALTKAIINADYNKDLARVKGIWYKRIEYQQVTNFEGAPWKGFRYFKVEPIRWRILEEKDGELLLLAEKALDSAVYQNTRELQNSTWKECTLRAWLNNSNKEYTVKQGFLSAAFTETELEAVINGTVKNTKNPAYGTLAGENTKDRAYLLSMAEVRNSSYGFAGDTDTKDDKRITYLTDYARVLGAFDDGKGACWWMLRTPGENQMSCAIVYGGGRVETKGMPVNDHSLAVRPVIRVDLSKVKVKR